MAYILALLFVILIGGDSMKKILLILFLFFINCDTITNNKSSDLEYSINSIPKKLINSNNDFSLRLFRILNPHDRDGNIFISPVSVSFALGMTMNGSDGNTFDEMKTTLGFADFVLENINSTYADLIEELYNVSEGVEFNLANSIWFTDDLSLQSGFQSINKSYFDTKVEALDFGQKSECVNIVNKWVEDQTNEKIKDFTNELDFNSIMLLVNAIYFNADWKYQFDEDITEKLPFYLNDAGFTTCDMMSQKCKFKYIQNSELQAVELPYANENYAMIMIQPNNTIDNYIEDFDRSRLNDILDNFKKDSVNLTIPKLEIEYEKELSDILKEMGIVDAFDANKADFSKMFNELAGGIYIKLVRQKSFINLDEKGTEAAAATVVVMDYKSAGGDDNNEIYLTFNKPFIFLIREKRSESILFCGKVINPIL